MKKILIYSFEKFGNLSLNPAAEIAEQVKKNLEGKFEVKLNIIPTTFDSFNILKETIKDFNPELIIGFGVSNRPLISIEAIGLNIMDSQKPDNEGKIIKNQPIDSESPLALKTSFNIEELNQEYNKENIPSKISYHADTYVCNYAYFNCLNLIKKENLNSKAIFIHVPMSPEEVINLGVNSPSFPKNLISNATSKAIEKIIK
ncbi:MAG: hypothetical protein KC506_02670 [Nanoarchaeota archaeon]|nr:hypothetical protein [Nanoarchaeota archaeon]